MALTIEQVAQHNTQSSCWLIVKRRVYDVTSFLAEHPGGTKVILQFAGKDATTAYESIHPLSFLDEYLSKDKHLGSIDLDDSAPAGADGQVKKTKDMRRVELERKRKPPINRMLSSADIEDVAMRVLPRKARSYYASGGDDGISLRENVRAFSRFFFKPRVLRKVSQCDPSTTILGHKTSIPVYISFAGLAKLAHPNGDLNFTRSAGQTGIIQMVGTNPSFSHAEIAAARLTPQQPLFLQLYKNPDNEIAKRFVQRAEQLGYKAIFLTVDAPVLGNRETDIKAPFEEEDEEREGEPLPPQDEEVEAGGSEGGVASAFSKQDDADKTWEETIPWLRSITKLPIVVKGIQCVEDAVLAAEAGVDGIVLSNHGGRQLDYAPPSIETLHQLRLRHPEVFEKLEVFIDGGVRRGTDVLKALCLGAKAVGMGRPFNYANSAYGEAGVVKLIRIMEREIVTGMRLLGAARVSDLTPEMVMRVDFYSKL